VTSRVAFDAIGDAAATVHRGAAFLAQGTHHGPVRVLGNGLRELDALFGTFLETVSLALSAAPSLYPDSYVRGSSIRQTHSANRLRSLSSGMGIDSPHDGALRSLRKAGDCLVFHAGKVAPSHTGRDSVLIVRWLASVAGEAPAARQRSFANGELLRLSRIDLAEICWSYRYLTNEMLGAVRKGLPLRPSRPATPLPPLQGRPSR
jgi:hypothetical protein